MTAKTINRRDFLKVVAFGTAAVTGWRLTTHKVGASGSPGSSPHRWAMAIGFAAFAVFIECILNIGCHLVWEYPWWNLYITGIWLIFIIGYFFFFAGAVLIIGMDQDKHKKIALAIIYAVPIIMNIIAFGILGWIY